MRYEVPFTINFLFKKHYSIVDLVHQGRYSLGEAKQHMPASPLPRKSPGSGTPACSPASRPPSPLATRGAPPAVTGHPVLCRRRPTRLRSSPHGTTVSARRAFLCTCPSATRAAVSLAPLGLALTYGRRTCRPPHPVRTPSAPHRHASRAVASTPAPWPGPAKSFQPAEVPCGVTWRWVITSKSCGYLTRAGGVRST